MWTSPVQYPGSTTRTCWLTSLGCRRALRSDTSGTYTNLVGDLRFVRRGSRLQVAGTGGVNARYYRQSFADFTASDYHVGFGCPPG